jgi:UDP-N-acetylglucosamine 2-epimerase (non-hydrolysing)
MRILNVVGARPNLMKIAPLMAEMTRFADIEPILLHTGQHYDDRMSQVFFDELDIPRPDIYLGVGSNTHAQQTAQIMTAFEDVIGANRPDLVVVVGDVNSTLACTVTAAKLNVPVAHVEAGLRSNDRTMPEEINRLVTDVLSDLLFTTSRDADENLIREGVAPVKIHIVGNVMIDTLEKHRARAEKLGTPEKFGLHQGEYALLTLHRPSNVDDPKIFAGILSALETIQQDIPILFPAHPRTYKRISEFGFQSRFEAATNIQIVDPLSYFQILDMMMHAKLVLTDSGGLQEETTIFGVPCLTIRENTERPVTITEGTNILVGTDPLKILTETRTILAGKSKSGRTPELWDGHASERIVKIIQDWHQEKNI